MIVLLTKFSRLIIYEYLKLKIPKKHFTPKGAFNNFKLASEFTVENDKVFFNVIRKKLMNVENAVYAILVDGVIVIVVLLKTVSQSVGLSLAYRVLIIALLRKIHISTLKVRRFLNVWKLVSMFVCADSYDERLDAESNIIKKSDLINNGWNRR